jgi:hypothetical protein
LRVEGKQLAGELSRPFARPGLQVLPGLAAELRQRRRPRSRPDVAGDLPDLLVRHVEAVLAPEGEVEVIAGDAGNGLRLEAEELADAVILVDDEVAEAEVGEALECTAEPGIGTGRPLAEDLRVGE